VTRVKRKTFALEECSKLNLSTQHLRKNKLEENSKTNDNNYFVKKINKTIFNVFDFSSLQIHHVCNMQNCNQSLTTTDPFKRVEI